MKKSRKNVFPFSSRTLCIWHVFFCFMQHIWIGTNGIHLYIRTHTEASNRKFERIRGTLLPLTFVSYTFPCRRFMKEVKKGKKSNNKTPETYAFIEQRWYCRCLCHHHTHWIHLFSPQKSQNRHLSFAALCMQLFDTKKMRWKKWVWKGDRSTKAVNGR